MPLAIYKQAGLFNPRELEEIERRFSVGISSQQVIELFQSRGVKLSEATFRKYVQLGLLPTSKRVGRKGKHRGSRGIYPVTIVRRINLIKGMMDQDMTLEEIRDSFLSVHNGVIKASEALDSLFDRISDRLGRLEAAGRSVSGLTRDANDISKLSADLMKKIDKLSSRLAVIGSSNVSKDQGGST
jgi:DNA-binding transcriptional MerR regulator